MIRFPRSQRPGKRSESTAPKLRPRQAARGQFRAWAERLEDRTVMATLNLVANQLIYTAGPSVANALTVSTTGPGGFYTITEAAETVTLSQSAIDAGWYNITPFTVTGPDASVTKLSIGLLDAANSINIQSISCDATIQTVSAADTYSFVGTGILAGATVSVVPSFLPPLYSAGTFDFNFQPGTVSVDDTGVISRYQVDGHGAVVDYSGELSAGISNVGLLNVPIGGLTLGVNTLGTSPSPVDVVNVITSDAPGSTHITSTNPSGVFFQRSFTTSLLNKIRVGGTSATDTTTVDYSNGDPIPVGGLAFDGGPGGFDTLTLMGDGITFDNESINATGPGAGTIDYSYNSSGGYQYRTIQFSNLAPINDIVPAASLSLTTPLAAENVDVLPGPVIFSNQTTTVSGPGNPFELVNFANKSTFNLSTTGNTGTVRVDTSTSAAGLALVNITSVSGQSAVQYIAGNPATFYSLNASSGVPTLSDGSVTTLVHGASSLSITAGPSFLVLSVTGTTGNDDFVATETSAIAGDLSVTLANLPVLATGFQHYSLSGNGAGIDSVRVVGSNGPETATFNDGTVTLTTFTVFATPDIPNIAIDLPGGPSNHLNFATLLSGSLYRALVGDETNAATFKIYSDASATTLLRTVRVSGITTTSFPEGQELEVWGTSAANHFYMSDITPYVRANNGPYLEYVAFTNVGLYGGGFADDHLDYEANLTGAGSYTFTPGNHPSLVTPTTTISIDAIESMGMYGPGAAGALTIATIPIGESLGTAVDYNATVTGPGQGNLSAAFNQPTTFRLDAQNFGTYNLGGSTAGTSSLVVNGPATDATATYSGSAVTVNGMVLNLADNIKALTINLQNAPGSALTVAATGATQTFRVRENDAQNNANIEIFATPPANPAPPANRTLDLQGVPTVRFSGVGSSNVLELWGTGGITHFAMSDRTNHVRASNGSNLDFSPFSTLNLFGSGFAADRLDYEASLTSAYTLTGGQSPTLLVPLPGHTVVVSLAGIESMGMYGPGATGILHVQGVPLGSGQGAAVNYQLAVTGPGQGSLDAAFNQPTLYTLHAEGFGEYGLAGSGSGESTASVQGTWGNDTASYDGSVLVVDGLRVAAGPSISRLWLDLLGGSDSIALSGAGATDAFSIAPATGGTVTGPLTATIGSLRPLRMNSVESISLIPSGSGNSLNVTGDANDNAISMSDQTVRFGQGPNINFAGIGSVALFGAGGVDSLTYNGGNNAYSFDPRTFTQGILATTGLTTTFHNVSAFRFLGNPSAPANFQLFEAPTATVTIQLQYPPASGYLSTVMQAMTITAEGVRNFTLVPSWGDNTVNLEGTPGSDSVTSSGSIVTINGVGVDLGVGTTRLNVNTYDGDDTIILPLTLSGLTVYVHSGDQNDNVSMVGATVQSVLETGKGFSAIRGGDGTTTILAGGGLNSIYVGGGNTLVMGRNGQNTIYGGTGRSLIITGKNYAKVQKGTGGKYVVTGTTSYDNFLPALDRILAEWSSSASYKVRVRHIRNGTGSILGGVQLQVDRTVKLSNRKSRIVGVNGVDKILAGPTDKVGTVPPTVTVTVAPARLRHRKAGK